MPDGLRPEIKLGDGWRSHDRLKSKQRSSVTTPDTRHAWESDTLVMFLYALCTGIKHSEMQLLQ